METQAQPVAVPPCPVPSLLGPLFLISAYVVKCLIFSVGSGFLLGHGKGSNTQRAGRMRAGGSAALPPSQGLPPPLCLLLILVTHQEGLNVLLSKFP